MKRKKWLALGLTAALVMSPVTGVYAQESDDAYETIESGDYEESQVDDISNQESDAKDEAAVQAAENSNIAAVSNEGIVGETGKNTTVTGDVTTTGEISDGVTADGSNTKVTVKGNVTVSGTGSAGVSANNNATVEVTGNVQSKGDNQTHEGQTGGTYIDKWADGVEADNGSKVTVGGNVTSQKGWAIDSHGSDVTVNGDVHSEEGSAINARESSTVTIDGSVSSNAGITLGGIIETTDSTIKITKDVTAKNAWGILAGPGADIEVGGNVSSEKEAVYITGNGALIVVDGNVYSTKGCAMDVLDQSEAIVKGDVSGKDLAAWMNNSSKLQVLGKISSNDTGILITLSYDGKETGELNLGTIDAWNAAISINYGACTDIDKILAALPEMTVYKMNADTLLRLYTKDGAYFSPDDEKSLADKILKEKLQYAIRKQDTSNGKINIANELTKAKEGQTLTFSVVANDGYEVDSVSAGGENIPVIKNDNGTYSITVPKGGGVNISAIFKSIKQDPTPDPTPNPTPTPDPEPTPGTVIPSDAQQTSILSVAEDTEVVVIPQSWYSTKQQEFQQVVNTIPQNGVCILEADDLISFNRKTFAAFSNRTDITYVIIYKWNGNTYQTVIPAGYPVMDLLNEDGYCGCLYLNSVFGSTLID